VSRASASCERVGEDDLVISREEVADRRIGGPIVVAVDALLVMSTWAAFVVIVVRCATGEWPWQ
jgi:hypothetical protein